MSDLYIDGTMHFPTYDTVPVESVDKLFESLKGFSVDIVKLDNSGKTTKAKEYAARQVTSARKALRKLIKEDGFNPSEKWGELLMLAHGKSYLTRCCKILENVDEDKREEVAKKLVDMLSHIQHTISSLKTDPKRESKGAAKTD